MPAVSVIIPTYNSAHFVVEAVESVLAQTWQDLEIVVIDDGSTDETAAVMTRFGPPVRYIQQRNGGVAVARNKGIRESSGKYIAFLDADDTWLPEKLEKQIELLEKDQDARACYSAYSSVSSDLQPLGICRSIRHGSAIEDLSRTWQHHWEHMHSCLRARAVRYCRRVRSRPEPVRRLGHVGPDGTSH